MKGGMYMLNMWSGNVKGLLKGKKGQGMVEYGLIIGLIAIVVIVALTAVGGQLGILFETIKTKLTGVV